MKKTKYAKVQTALFICLLFPIVVATAGPNPADAIDYTVSGTVVALAQPTDQTCWATAATILVSWKEMRSLAISDVMDRAGPAYRTKFDNNQGISGAEKPDFLNSLGLQSEGPQNYTVQGWLSLLKQFGPLWVTTNEGSAQAYSPHARVLKGMFGDGSPDATFLKIVDPAGGTEYSESITTFTKKFEDIARQDLGDGADLRPQVVHFPQSVGKEPNKASVRK